MPNLRTRGLCPLDPRKGLCPLTPPGGSAPWTPARGLCPLDPRQGLCPWTPPGGKPPGPPTGLALNTQRAHGMCIYFATVRVLKPRFLDGFVLRSRSAVTADHDIRAHPPKNLCFNPLPFAKYMHIPAHTPISGKFLLFKTPALTPKKKFISGTKTVVQVRPKKILFRV